MNLEQLLSRAQEIETAIINATAQLNSLHGHKIEMEHWISKHKASADETQVEHLDEPVVG